MNGRAARGGCQAPNFPAQMEPNTAQHGPSSPQTVCVCVRCMCGEFYGNVSLLYEVFFFFLFRPNIGFLAQCL